MIKNKTFFLLLICFVIIVLTGCNRKITGNISENKETLQPTKLSTQEPTSTPMQEVTNPDFRNVKWGFSMSQVKKE